MVRVLLLLICNQLIPLVTAAATATGGCGVAHRPTLPSPPLKNQDETNKLLSDTVLVGGGGGGSGGGKRILSSLSSAAD